MLKIYPYSVEWGFFLTLSFGASNDFLDILCEVSDTVFTTNGEGEHTRYTSRKVARKPCEKEAGLGGMKAVAIR